MSITHKTYPSDVSDAEWQFVVPYLCLLPEDAGQRVHDLRDVFDALRWLVRSGPPAAPRGRLPPRGLPPGGGVLSAAPPLARRRLLRGPRPRPPRRAPLRR